ncbi:MAG: hypothetical protein NZR01_09190 [Bryobacteraceae bacterium]|nr:hypothetical protein [Bryobacteraceae bacterium]
MPGSGLKIQVGFAQDIAYAAVSRLIGLASRMDWMFVAHAQQAVVPDAAASAT